MNDAAVLALARSMDVSCVQSRNTAQEVDAMADAACRHRFVCAFSLPVFTKRLARRLRGTDTAVGGVVGFPSGCGTTASKVFEAKELAALGCCELDMVIQVGRMRAGDIGFVEGDIAAVVEAAGGLPVKAILEVSLLTDEQIVCACEAAVSAGASFVKSATGWMSAPTTVEQVALMKRAVGPRARIKAAGGIRDLATLLAMRAAGCDRFGVGLAHALHILEQARADV